MKHELDDGLPIFGDMGDITDPDERYAFFETIPAEKMAYLRNERNRKLAETDWWANSDVTMTEAQRQYRQDLRDITNTYSSLDDVVWPTKP